METDANENIALLIDCDNAPSTKIDFIIAELATRGVVNIRRAYGNWKKPTLSGWERVLNEYAIQPIQHFDLIKGKNATDMGMTIDAVDILYTKNVGTFCLVSSDCDFTPLVCRLRAEGRRVIGFGGKKTPEPFVNACSRFLYLDEDEESKTIRENKIENVLNLKKDSKLMNLLCHAVEAAGDEDGWARLGPVGAQISNQAPFDPRNFGFRKLSDLFAAVDLFEVRREPESGGGSSVFVRNKDAKK